MSHARLFQSHAQQNVMYNMSMYKPPIFDKDVWGRLGQNWYVINFDVYLLKAYYVELQHRYVILKFSIYRNKGYGTLYIVT